MVVRLFRNQETGVRFSALALMNLPLENLPLEILNSLWLKLEPTKFQLDPWSLVLYENFSCAYTRRQIWIDGDEIVVNLYGSGTNGWRFSLADPNYEDKIRILIKDRLGKNG